MSGCIDVLTEFKEILCKAIKAHEIMSESDYDDGFHNGLLHSLTLLNNFEREKQEQAKDYPKLRALFVDYSPAEGCKNDESYGAVCVKCGKCGRKFGDFGIMTVDEYGFETGDSFEKTLKESEKAKAKKKAIKQLMEVFDKIYEDNEEENE